MGVFNFISNQFRNAMSEAATAELEAQDWDPRRIGEAIARSGMLKKAGYVKVLRAKCDTLNERELMRLFDEFWDRRNVMALKAMAPIMERRGLLRRGEGGQLIRTYR